MIKKMKKREAYLAGFYVFSPPPVCTAFWRIDDWIRMIDLSSGWLVEVIDD